MSVLNTGINLGVSIHHGSLAQSFSIPNVFRNRATGLMGNFNDNPDDDFILPNGTMLPNDMTERQIFNQFGSQCKNNSLSWEECV